MRHFSWLRLIFKTQDSAATILIRSLVSVVFISEGVQKLIFSGMLDNVWLTRLGIPYAKVFGPLVGSIEVTCGIMIILGLLTRLASIPLIIVMIVAIISTKTPILLGENWWIFHLPDSQRSEFWSTMHEIRANISMFLALIYLLIRGAGQWSLDECIYQVLSIKHHKITDQR